MVGRVGEACMGAQSCSCLQASVFERQATAAAGSAAVMRGLEAGGGAHC